MKLIFAGCGNGKYLSINPSIYKIGLDRCSNLANIAREKEHEVCRSFISIKCNITCIGFTFPII